MESRPLLTSFQIGGSTGDALPGNEHAVTRQTAQYRLIADYSNIIGQSDCALGAASPVRNNFCLIPAGS
jgi:hypothetical protein